MLFLTHVLTQNSCSKKSTKSTDKNCFVFSLLVLHCVIWTHAKLYQLEWSMWNNIHLAFKPPTFSPGHGVPLGVTLNFLRHPPVRQCNPQTLTPGKVRLKSRIKVGKGYWQVTADTCVFQFWSKDVLYWVSKFSFRCIWESLLITFLNAFTYL